MKFNNEQEVRDAYKLLNDLWGKSWTVYSPMKINTDLTISFTADSYFDPVLSFFKLMDKNVIDAKIEWAGSETDKVIISGCNMDILKKIALIKPFPDYNTIGSVLYKLCPRDEQQIKKPDPPHIMLGDDIIPYKDWKDYWALQGKEGPESGWEIPTKQQLYDSLSKK